MRVADGQADGLVGELVNVGRAQTIARALGIGPEIVQRVEFVARIQSHDATADRERLDGLEIEGARQALANEARIRRLVHGHTAHEFRRVLIKLDPTVITRAHLLTAVEERGGEIRRQTADGNNLCATGDPLCRQTGQAGQRFGDADVRQFSDIL